MAKKSILLPLVMGSNPRRMKTTPWHDAFFKQREHRETIRTVSLHPRMMSFCLELPQPVSREQSIGESDDVVRFGGNVLMNRAGHEGMMITGIANSLISAMTNKETIWGPLIEQKLKHFALTINACAYWISPESAQNYPKAHYILMDHPGPLFGCPHGDVLADAISQSMNEVDEHERDIVYVLPVLAPSLSRDSSAHEILSQITKIKTDIKFSEDRRYHSYGNIHNTEVLNPIFIDSLW